MRYGARDVLDGVDLDVRRGEVLALLGPNGAGKSTTIEILEGFRRRSGGQVSVLGVDPEDASDDWRARVGIVVQSWRDHARWQVGELLEHFARYYPDPRSPGELLDAVGLTAQARQECRLLSGGQRRRLDVALGIIGRPELLFLDEPTTGFDPESRRDFHRLIERLRAAEGMTILLTTHDLAEAERLSDSIAILVGGRLIASGPVAGLAERIQAQAEVRWVQDGVRQSLLTTDPSQAVWELHQEFDGPVPGLEVRRPTLEDTYLGMLRQENA
ncbi:ABC transporter [Streptomyces davaonensis JCM 4913]|uniref:ABC transporter n=1 Tax=Streptomyces davaonensis (strain DSM 101723 / JCM 4913 / KCC S-0913 / 768) TaxID=1214101 RepID=K4R740_STRDJ|nr:ABC transporter ATP-binding protein [Streptomyces davaonensis]CCK28870.1 ABC transporter [Streptomyces davaonensis JCM 4913]